MFKDRHCVISDYRLLEKISQDFLAIINRDNFDIKSIEKYLSTFSDFDNDIAFKMRIYLEKINEDPSKYRNKIASLVEELTNNVLVDIREHN